MNSIKTNLIFIINTLHNLTNKKKVAIGFFGITRSLKYTIDSIKTNIFDVLTENNIDYDIFMHTYYLNSYSNKRARESITNKINNDEYKLLNPKYFHQDDQDKIKNKLKLELYRTHKDPWHTNYESVDFFILACYSKFILTEMIEKTDINYDYILFVRPDCLYLDKLDISKFKLINNNTILIPNFGLTSNINDRFAITNNSTYKIYGKIFTELLKLSKKRQLHSESILDLILNNNKIKNIKIPFNFSRIRYNGKVCHNDNFSNYKNVLEKYKILNIPINMNSEEYKTFENISLFLEKNTDTNITFCVANNAVLDMVRNLLISSNKNNVNITLFALDNNIISNLEGQCNIVKYFDNGFGEKIDDTIFYKYGTDMFKNVIFQRFFIGNEILKANKSYIYMDVDIVVTKNFINNILEQYINTNYDCLSQDNGDGCCTGFFSMKSNEKTKKVDLNFFKKHNYKLHSTNQKFFNKYVLKTKVLNIKLLDRTFYPTGNIYYKNHKNIDDKCYIIHFNFIIGYNTKIDKMKFYNKFYIK